jgi:F-type H+-transporting ATPase subunit b
MSVELALFQVYKWYDYPGVELWKFLNLAILAAGIYYLVQKVFIPALNARREIIRQELTKAQQERDAANEKLAEVEARLAQLDAAIEKLRQEAILEAELERKRIRLATEEEAAKLREQARREIEAAGKAARQQLRRFAAEETVRFAEQLIRRDMRTDDDERLIELEVAELGGRRR